MMATPARGDAPQLGGIPESLKRQKRWAPWVAKWSAQRGKFDKIPRDAVHPERGLSTTTPDKWFTFEQAQSAYLANPEALSGVGFVLTGAPGVTGIDMDGCVDPQAFAASGGTEGVEAWAREVVDRLGGYVEISPSGRGLRMFVTGAHGDWCNHQVGVEVYDGTAARFLTVTGRRLPGSAADVQAPTPGALTWLAATYRLTRPARTGSAETPGMPELTTVVPGLSALEAELPPVVRDFVCDGVAAGGDRSKLVYRAAISFTKMGLSAGQVWSALVDNRHCIDVALAHRGGDLERAKQYLWEHHVVPAAREVGGNVLRDDDFEQLPPTEGAVVGATGEHGGAAGGVAKLKYHLYTTDQFMSQRRRMEWFIRGVLPRGELAVMFGASGAGKTFCLLHMLAHMAMGREWCGFAVVRPVRIVYVVAEGVVGLGMRLRALCLKMGVDVRDVPLRIVTVAPNMLDKEDVKTFLHDAHQQMPMDADLFVFDTMSQVLPGANENSSEDMGVALRNFKALHRRTGGMVFLVGHTGKDAAKGHRGWSGIRGALDAELEVERRLTHRALKITKLKDGKGEGTEVLFDLEPVELSWDDPDEGPVTEDTCVMQPLLSTMERDAVLSQEAQAAQESKERAKDERKAGKQDDKHLPEALDAMREAYEKTGVPVKRAAIAAVLAKGAWAGAAEGTIDTRLKALLRTLVERGDAAVEGSDWKAHLYRPADDNTGLVDD